MKYVATRLDFDKQTKKKLSTGDDYGILLVLRGVAYISDCRKISTDEMLVCKPNQKLTLEHPGGRFPLTVFWVRISQSLMREYSTERTDLVASFQVNPEPIAQVRGQSEMLMLIKSLSSRMMNMPQETSQYASEIMEEGTLKMFICLVLRTCILSDLRRVRKGGHLTLDEVFSYIHTHLTEELPLERLEREFYVSRQHLIRQFKQRTGMTVHQYIIKARLDLCRNCIEQGLPITEVCHRSGFGSYNHLFRAFKQEYGMTPKEYYKTVSSHGLKGKTPSGK